MNYKVKGTALDATATAIQQFTGQSSKLYWDDLTGYVDDIAAIVIGNDTSDANATAADILSGKTAYVKGSKVTGNITTKTSADLTASGFTVTVPSGYYSVPATKSVAGGGGGNDAEDSIIMRTISGSYENNRVTTIGDFAFRDCISLTTASFPVCTTIGSYAFASCYSLTMASFPACTWIGAYAFNYCSRLTTASFPVCTTIGSYAFASCYSLTTASFPICKTIRSNAFASCSGLTTVILSVAFNATQTASMIYSSAFYRCYNLTSLYLVANTMYNLSNVNAFTSTPISNYTTSTGGVYGSIFVRASMLASYKAATNWATYSARFVSLTDAQVSKVMASGTHT